MQIFQVLIKIVVEKEIKHKKNKSYYFQDLLHKISNFNNQYHLINIWITWLEITILMIATVALTVSYPKR